MIWDEAEVALLRKLSLDGRSCSQIGKAMGCSRSAVIGKLHRLGIKHGPTAINDARHFRAKPQPKPKAPPMAQKRSSITGGFQHSGMLPRAPLPEQRQTDVARVDFAGLEPHHCRFPIGEPVEGFCGHPKVGGIAYCEHHASRCYQPIPSYWGKSAGVNHAPALGYTQHRIVDEFLKENA